MGVFYDVTQQDATFNLQPTDATTTNFFSKLSNSLTPLTATDAIENLSGSPTTATQSAIELENKQILAASVDGAALTLPNHLPTEPIELGIEADASLEVGDVPSTDDLFGVDALGTGLVAPNLTTTQAAKHWNLTSLAPFTLDQTDLGLTNTTLGLTNTTLGLTNTTLGLTNTTLGLTNTTYIWGTPVSDAQYWRHQETNDSCAIAAQLAVYHSIEGVNISESSARNYAQRQGWYTPGNGTFYWNSGKILNALGVNTDQSYGDFDELLDALADGDKVIVALDANELWHNQAYYELPNWGHAVWVTGVTYNPSTRAVKVILNDSGTSYGRMETVSGAVFMNAWNDYSKYMVVADA